MSSTSTLRICLAAMAPALTEVTARLKLQDSSVGTESASKLDNNSNENKITVLQRSYQAIRGDLNTLGGLKRSKEDRPAASHLSHTLKRNGAHFQPKRSATVCDNARNSSFPCSVVNANALTNIKTLHIGEPHIASLSVTEDFKGGLSSKANQFIDNLKIMNQPRIATDKPFEQDDVESKECAVGEGLVNSSSCIKVTLKPPVMVNGSGDLNRKNDLEELSVAENRDVKARKGIQSLEGKPVHCTQSSTQTLISSARKMGICVQNNQAYPTSGKESTSKSGIESASKSDAQVDEKSKEDMRKECGKKQAYLERKVDTLLRRLKRMKGKVVEMHTREQLKQFVSYQHKNLQKVAKTIKSEAPGPDELKEYFLSNEEVKNMSTAQLVKLVKTYQPNQSEGVSNMSTKQTNSSAMVMDPTVRDQSLKIAERLAQRVETAAAELDSDATASSSGGESGDEDITTPTHHPADLPPLLKRAEWKWAVDRAAVVSRWSWLQAQVSDLEYRIRQQSQVHRQLRNSKGGVVLGDPPTAVEILRKLQGMPAKLVENSGSDGKTSDTFAGSEVSPCNISAVMSNVDKQASRLSQSLGNCLSPASSTFGSPASSSKISSLFVNGLTDSPCSTSTSETISESSPMIPTELRLTDKTSDLLEHIAADATCQAARCRPLRSYRKRKILRTIGLYKTSLKAARLSDIRCRCYPPANPCPICGGRYNNTLTIDPETMSLNERVAILDPSFHPVLSFPHDIPLSIHCEGLLKSGLWQNKPLPRRSRVREYRKQKVITLVTEPIKKSGNNRQNGRNSNPTSVINFSTKIKNKYETKKSKAVGSKASMKPCINKVKKKAAKMARESMRKSLQDEDDDDLEAYLDQELNASIGRDSVLAGSASQSSLKDIRDVHHRKRKVDNSFDINNIVIPLSMAASTRVEQPQYKEIVTPKWREVPEHPAAPECIDYSITKKLEKTNGVLLPMEQQKLNPSLEQEVDEDLSDDKFAARHSFLEQEEKKRFRNFLQYPPMRRRARSDVVSVSSAAGEKLGSLDRSDGGDSQHALTTVAEDSLPSRPTTPVFNRSLHPACIQSISVEDSMDSLQQQLSVRRRTMSFSKRERSSSIMCEDVHNSLIEVGGVEPWPRRTFPLSEDEYKHMMEDLPPSYEPVHQRLARRLAEPSGKVYVGGSVEITDDTGAVPSPHPSTESMSSAGDDPNDPEWVGGEASKRSRTRRVHEDPGDPEWTGSDTPRRSKNKR